MPTPELLPEIEPVSVLSRNGGPFPGLRIGNVIVYEFELGPAWTPRPGELPIMRPFVLLDVGVQLTNPAWWTGEDATSWYVDLVSVSDTGDTISIRDLYIDVIVPTDGRHHRMLDLEEFADAIEDGALSLTEAVDGLRRWQAFLDRYIHTDRMPSREWSDFPPASMLALKDLSPLTWSDATRGSIG